MGRFKRFVELNEAAPIQLKDVNMTKGTKPAVVFPGRFQPPTKAHGLVIKQMKSKYPKAEPIVFIVRGEKSGQDKKKNPFSVDTQMAMLKKSTDVKRVLIVPNAFIGTFINEARNQGYEIEGIFCGTDRAKGYQSQIDRYKDELDIAIDVNEIKRSNEDISATKVRNALIDNDWNTFKKMTTKLDKKDFIRLQNEIKSVQGK